MCHFLKKLFYKQTDFVIIEETNNMKYPLTIILNQLKYALDITSDLLKKIHIYR